MPALSEGALPIPFVFLQTLPTSEAVLLAYLYRTADRAKADLRDGWFQCSAQLIENMTGIKSATQTRLFHCLESRGLIKTERRGQGARRWIRITDSW